MNISIKPFIVSCNNNKNDMYSTKIPKRADIINNKIRKYKTLYIDTHHTLLKIEQDKQLMKNNEYYCEVDIWKSLSDLCKHVYEMKKEIYRFKKNEINTNIKTDNNINDKIV